MKQFITLATSTAIALSVLAGSGIAQQTDEDGCYNASGCLVYTKQKWLKAKGHFMIGFRNNCAKGIYVNMCLEKEGGRWSCGSTHVGPGRSDTWDTYAATGRSDIQWVGSARSHSDWVCAGKIRDWYNFH